jgi:hypothetical protein
MIGCSKKEVKEHEMTYYEELVGRGGNHQMPENVQGLTDSDRRQFLQMALSESVEQSGGNFNKAIGDLGNAGKLNVRAGVYDLAAGKISLS